MLRHHGESRRYFHDRVGYNYRMDGFQGAVLRVKLKHLDAWTARRREIARLYRECLAGARIEMPEDDPSAESVYHLFVVYIDGRDQVRRALAARGVGTAIHYPRPVHLQDAYGYLGRKPGSFPYAERACERVLSMPLFPEMTMEQAEHAAQTLTDIVGRR
jgi:dTDP-4-amino-4,6-dideoxygalactose transaminase